MIETRNAVKSFFTMFFCGISAMNLFPTSNYAKNVPPNAVCITRESWKLTGVALKHAMDRVEVIVGAKQ
ncbi:MAG: hypothetical protein ACLVHE_02130 [Dialister invisus]|uniref:hypothetical protein n=1 Tax=Dialister invisus TaxID=218538 RepID=UPI003999B1B8